MIQYYCLWFFFSLNYLFRARGKVSDDQALHRFVIWSHTLIIVYILVHNVILWYYRCVVAYASDLLYFGVSLNPHREKGLKTYSLSLDHSYVFYYIRYSDSNHHLFITSAKFCLFLLLLVIVLQDLVPQACEGWWLVAVCGKQLSISSSDTDTK